MIRITGTLHEDLCTLILVSQGILLRIMNVSDRSCRDNQNTLFMLNNFFLEIVPFVRLCGKIWYHQISHRWQYNTACALCMLEN